MQETVAFVVTAACINSVLSLNFNLFDRDKFNADSFRIDIVTSPDGDVLKHHETHINLR